MVLQINFRSGKPVYLQIVDQIKDFNPAQDTIQLENSIFTNGYLTTPGNESSDDIKTIRDWGYSPEYAALSVALLICSSVWLAGAGVWYATSAFKSDWSATPLFWMLILMVTPAICFSIVLILSDTRKHRRFSRLDWCALVAGFFPVTLGTVFAGWAVKVLFSMSGLGN
jgi:hypothetical protein